MTWDEILNHKFVKGNILILEGDQVSDSPFTRPRAPQDQQKSEKNLHAASIARISQLKKQELGIGEDINVMSSRDSIKVNLNLQSDMDETDNENELLMLKNESDGLETSGEACEDKQELSELLKGDDFEKPQMMLPGRFHNVQQFQLEPPRVHNIATFQPVAENSNMVMHRFLDNFDPEMHNFLMTPAIMMPSQHPMFPPVQKITQDLENFSLRMEKSVEVPTAQSLKKSQKTQSDGVSTDVSSVPVETEEWLQFLFKAMQEILDGDLEIYKQDNMMTMIVGLLRNPKYNSKLIDHVVQIICLPFGAIDMPQSILEDIDKLYLQMKLVPNLVYASKLLCSRKFQQNSMDMMSIPKVDEMIRFTEAELKTLSGIYDLVVYLVYSGETFLHMLCDAISILNLDHLFRSFIASGIESDSKSGVRLTGSMISLICAILQDIPENANLIEKIIFHDEVDLCKLLRHDEAKIRLRTCLMVRLLGRFCCFALQNQWNHEMSSCLEDLMTDVDDEVRNETMNIIEEFKDCVGWFKMENF
jgi:fused